MRKKFSFCLMILLLSYSSSLYTQILKEKAFPIEHVVIIVKENRSFDHYFGKLKGVDGATTAKLSNGTEIPLKRAAKDIDGEKVKTGWGASLTAVNNGAMDGFDKVPDMGMNETFCQQDSLDIPNYFIYANTYAICDKFFGSTNGSSFGNHLYMVAGQAGGAIGNPEPASIFEHLYPWGWAAPEHIIVHRYHRNNNGEEIFDTGLPRYDFTTIVDKIKNKGLTWNEFCPVLKFRNVFLFNLMFGMNIKEEYKYSGFGAIKHIFESNEFKTNIHNIDQFQNVLKSQGLANYTFLSNTFSIPPIYESLYGTLADQFLQPGITIPTTSEHPPLGPAEGEKFTVDIINAIMASEYWNKTAIFVTWDNYGGFYDHVPPPQIDDYGLGLRVPCLIISPWVKKGVHSEVFEFGSINKFIKTIFNTDGFLSARDSLANDIISCFDFNQAPLPPKILPEGPTEVTDLLPLPDKIVLNQNFPNPFNSSTTIDFILPKAGNVTLKVYDLMGKEAATLINNTYMQAGYYPVKFQSNSLSSGTYIYRITLDGFAEEKKMVLLK